ncbi:MAG: DinB family protein [Bacteroidota bacterium]
MARSSAEGMKSYQSQLSHITTWLRTHSRFVTGHTFEKTNTKTKADIIQSLEEFFQFITEFLEKVAEESLEEIQELWYGKVSRHFVLQVMDNHLSHHRGQMIVYLRLQGITPPAYIGW